MPNNIAYYVNGTPTQARELKLVMNVNDKKAADETRRELVGAARVLYQNALGRELPKEVEESLANGTAGDWSGESDRVIVTRDDWPTGAGYEVHLILSLTK